MWYVLLLLLPSASAAVLKGRVIEDHSGSPVVGANVRVYRIGERGLVADLETDGGGRFESPELAGAEFRLEILKANYVDATLQVRAEIPLVRLIRRGVITGRVSDVQGAPLQGVMIFAMPIREGRPARPAYGSGQYANVGSRGQYRLYNLAPGRYVVSASWGASSYRVGSTGDAGARSGNGSGFLFYRELLIITGGEEHRNIDFLIQGTSLYSVSGKVQLKAPKRGFWLALSAVEQPGLAANVTLAGDDGSFRFDGVRTGSYHLFVSGPSSGRGGMGAQLDPDPLFARTRVEVNSGDVEGLALTPVPGRALTVVLRGAETCPANGQLQFAALEDWSAWLDRTQPAEIGKPVRVADLAPGRYALSAGGLDNKCFGETVIDLTGEAGNSLVELRVLAAGHIEGGSEGHSVALYPTEPGETSRTALVNSEGQFSFPGLRPGKYRLVARPKDETQPATTASEVEVRAGVKTEVTLR